MRLPALLVLSVALAGAMPALADELTVLCGASAPPPPPAPPVVVQTVVVPMVVYAPTYYPDYGFYPGFFVGAGLGMRPPPATPVQATATGPLRPLLR
jgi:hypothetical protein